MENVPLTTDRPNTVAVIGAGPAGLWAAEVLAGAGCAVSVFDRKPTPGRKFMMAGIGGLNITHTEPLETFVTRYGGWADIMRPLLAEHSPDTLRQWCAGLGEPTFAGSSGRVFPASFKASPLLRAWRQRLEGLGVRFFLQHDWQGWDTDGSLIFKDAHGKDIHHRPAATLLALGGASWPRLGSDGGWAGLLRQRGVALRDFMPANCGFSIAWSDTFRDRFAGTPVKPLTLSFGGRHVPGEMMISKNGVEGGVIYALSADLRDGLARDGSAAPVADLRPGLDVAELTKRLSVPRGAKSLSNFLTRAGGLSPVAQGLLRELTPPDALQSLSPVALAQRIKALPLPLLAPFSLDRAISSAGGVTRDAVDAHFMLQALPGVFVAGEMLDWEAPTGGYLLQGAFCTARHAAAGILNRLKVAG